MLETPRAVFDLWPSLEAVAGAFKGAGHDISSSAISKWAQRGRIPPEYWVPLVGIAEDAGFDGVTFETLAVMHARSGADTEPAEARA
jgi:hypothetical protein